MIIVNLLIWCFLTFVLNISADEVCSKKGLEGKCTLVTNCLSKRKQSRTANPKNQILRCGDILGPRKICCTDPIMIPISQLLPTYEECGTESGGSKIYGGEEAALKDFPWMAILIYKSHIDNRLYISCAGSLISKRYVLTAAHCIHLSQKTLIKVRLGEHDTKTEQDYIVNQGCNLPPVDILIEEITIHSKYNHKNWQNDIALIRLAEDANFNDFIQPICLPDKNVEIKVNGSLTQMWASGWGATSDEKPYSTKKLKLKLKYQETAVCQEKYKWRNISDSLQFCAGGEKNKDTCNRDSGGPVMRQYLDHNLKCVKWFATGIVSYGLRVCGQQGQPAVYTRVNAYTDWIVSNLKA